MKKDKKDYKFLIIEDNTGDLIIVEEFLQEQIFSPVIVHAVSYKQASLMLRADQTFSAILLDLSLPDKNGQDLISEMLRITPPLCPVIVLTGYTDIDFSIKSIALGVMDYLLKDELTAMALYKSIIYSIERKNSISEVKASEKRYSDLFNLSPQPMWLFDTCTFRFAQVNQAAIALYDYSHEEFMSMTLMDIKLDEDVPKARDDIRRHKSADGIFKDTVRHQKKSGAVIEVEIYSTPITMNDKSYRSVIAIDVTEKNRHDHALIKAIIKTQEDERYEIGGELHDNVCQILAASNMSLGILKKFQLPDKTALFEQATTNITQALDEIRNISHRLAPVFFDDSSMEEAFIRLCNTFNSEKSVEIKLHVDKKIKECETSVELQLNLYRILQEQLRNIFKHAQATIVEIDVLVHNNKLKMRITDNGIGFDPCTVKKGIGLANMKRRAQLFLGKFAIHSSTRQGCEVLIDIPISC